MSYRGDQHVWGIRANETVWACVCGVKRGKLTGAAIYFWPITGRWRRKRPDCPHYGKLDAKKS